MNKKKEYMKAVVWDGPFKLSLQEVEKPIPSSVEVLIKTKADYYNIFPLLALIIVFTANPLLLRVVSIPSIGKVAFTKEESILASSKICS